MFPADVMSPIITVLQQQRSNEIQHDTMTYNVDHQPMACTILPVAAVFSGTCGCSAQPAHPFPTEKKIASNAGMLWGCLVELKSRACDVGIEEVQNPDLSLCRKEVTACDSITSIASRVTSQSCDGLPDVSLCVVDAQQTQQRSIAPGFTIITIIELLSRCCARRQRWMHANP